jgi:hypothetical protein
MTKTLVSTNSSTLAFAGIDVGAAELMLVIRKNAVSMKVQKFANTRPIGCAWSSGYRSFRR